ncbi:hypothetical protein AC578_5902 [Pseudocercospora eumusae]|uniref:Uncharacterized protein n=1 Tax=Pseudocercospora eumusae TaxID=321146 RepID=A0A139HBH3_9PEZI|nr:hypothetical protein AC578_5902 [Pseudocercospora eumusae]
MFRAYAPRVSPFLSADGSSSSVFGAISCVVGSVDSVGSCDAERYGDNHVAAGDLFGDEVVELEDILVCNGEEAREYLEEVLKGVGGGLDNVVYVAVIDPLVEELGSALRRHD